LQYYEVRGWNKRIVHKNRQPIFKHHYKREGKMKHSRIKIFVSLFFIFVFFENVVAQEPLPPIPLIQPGDSPTPTSIQYNSLYASAYTDLWSVNPYTGILTKIGPIGYEGTDIAFDGINLFGINFSQLLSIDPTTGTGSVIGNIGYSDVNALTIGPDGTMYAGTVSGAFLRINKSTGTGTLIGNYGPGLGSSGDLAIRYDNKMYATIVRSGYPTDWLALIDMNTGKATPIGDIGEWGVYGIDFKDWSLYGVTTNGYVLEIDTETGHSSRITTANVNFWGLSTSGPALIGNITSPADNYSTGPASIPINATAQYPGGASINRVEFYVKHDGIWSSLGNDTANPYTSVWETPSNLLTQQVLLRIDVVGIDIYNQIQRASYAGGVRRINYRQGMNNPDIVENWVPNRFYLNQRSLTPEGDSKCNVSSIAMVMAMDGYINGDYLTMVNKANELAPILLPNPDVNKECTALRRGIPSAYCSGAVNQTDAWIYTKNLVDLQHPVIIDTRPGVATRYGHYIVAVGYKEEAGRHYIIAYDPFGEWKGSYEEWYYNKSNDPASHIGKWVYYEFEEFTGDTVYLFATVSPQCTGNPPICTSSANTLSVIPTSNPDEMSDEAHNGGIFTGQELIIKHYLPMLQK
jgi:hypothetical protein